MPRWLPPCVGPTATREPLGFKLPSPAACQPMTWRPARACETSADLSRDPLGTGLRCYWASSVLASLGEVVGPLILWQHGDRLETPWTEHDSLAGSHAIRSPCLITGSRNLRAVCQWLGEDGRLVAATIRDPDRCSTIHTGCGLGPRTVEQGGILAAITAAGLMSCGPPRAWTAPLPQQLQHWMDRQAAIHGDGLNFAADVHARPTGQVVLGLLTTTINGMETAGPFLLWHTEMVPEWEQLCRDIPRCHVKVLTGIFVRASPWPLAQVGIREAPGLADAPPALTPLDPTPLRSARMDNPWVAGLAKGRIPELGWLTGPLLVIPKSFARRQRLCSAMS